ncbi:protein C19orf12 homolog [Artibeus jamaicensis]|uniref:protein C19orf12 homolog n=1 Tax=Artibeus jamaicensis TaxID=9417 RepID=UPI00235B2FB9|nr:protein C19orf12 homolog [Artibeus jamaicensis]XP_053528178.1 protein C19orf12 homolog [Artibeus jamaicensis]
MPVSVDDVMKLLCSISNKKGLEVVTKGQWRGVMHAGICAGIGGLLAGPPGIAVGGVLGGLMGAWMSKEKRRPASQVLKELSGAQQMKLFNKVKAIICNLDSMNNKQLTEWVLSSESLQQQLLHMLKDFFEKELKIPSAVQK